MLCKPSLHPSGLGRIFLFLSILTTPRGAAENKSAADAGDATALQHLLVINMRTLAHTHRHMMTHECYECVCLCLYICMLALLAHNS